MRGALLFKNLVLFRLLEVVHFISVVMLIVGGNWLAGKCAVTFTGSIYERLVR